MNTSPMPIDQDIYELLEDLKSVRAEYPPEMLARRRTAFMVQLTLMEKFSVRSFHSIESTDNDKVIEILENLKPVRTEYPSLLMAKQRSAFLDQAAKRRKAGWVHSLRSAFQGVFAFDTETLAIPVMSVLRKSLVLVSIIVIAFAGAVLGGNRERTAQVADIPPTRSEVSQPVAMNPTSTPESRTTTCTPGSTSPLCSSDGFDEDPAQAAWVSNSGEGWIKIDTGQTAPIHKVELDRKELGSARAEFTISVAMTENKYKKVYDSKEDDSTAVVSDGKTIEVSFAHRGTSNDRNLRGTWKVCTDQSYRSWYGY